MRAASLIGPRPGAGQGAATDSNNSVLVGMAIGVVVDAGSLAGCELSSRSVEVRLDGAVKLFFPGIAAAGASGTIGFCGLALSLSKRDEIGLLNSEMSASCCARGGAAPA